MINEMSMFGGELYLFKKLLLLVLLNFSLTTSAQDTFDLVLDLSGGTNSGASAVEILPDGSYAVMAAYIENYYTDGVLTGQQNSLRLVNLLPSGEVNWTTTVSSEDQEYFPANRESFRLTSDDHLICSCSVSDNGFAASTDFFPIKFDLEGNVVWSKRIETDMYESALSSVETSDGNYAFIGISGLAGNYTEDNLIVKLSSAGDLIWSKTYGQQGINEVGITLFALADEKLLVNTQVVYEGISGARYLLVEQLDQDGEVEQSTSYHQENGYSGGWMRSTFDGNYLYIYKKDTLPQTINPFGHSFLFKRNPEGDLLWELGFYSSSAKFLVDWKELADSTYIVVGVHYENAYQVAYGWMAQVSQDGQLLWEKNDFYINEEEDNIFWDIEATPDGGFIMVGEATKPGDSTSSIWAVKVNCEGEFEDDVGCPSQYVAPFPDPLALTSVPMDLSFRLYPNPARGSCQLAIDPELYQRGMRVQLRSVSAQLLFDHTVTGPDMFLDLSDLTDGVYWVSLWVDGKVKVSKRLVVLGD